MLTALCLALLTVSPPTPGDVVATVAGKAVIRAEAGTGRELFARVFTTLTGEFAKAEGITVSTDDIAAYAASVERNMERARLRWRTRIATLELERVSATSERQMAIDREIALYRETLELEEKAKERDRSIPASVTRDAQREVFSAMLRRYRIDQALYRLYGGRVVFQQAGPEPIDAYREFLRQAEKKGRFRIVDQTLAVEFWAYLTNDDHSFFPEAEGRLAMTTEWWLGQAGEETPE